MSATEPYALLVRDVSRSGHELSRRELEGLPERLTVRELLARRVAADAAAYNAEMGPVYRGLVQPADSIRHSDGFRMQRPRALDPDVLLAAVEEAVARRLLRVRAGDRLLEDLEEVLDVGAHDEIVIVLERPVVARGA